MTTLWDTTGTAVVKALAAERRTGGAVTSGNALTLIVVVDEHSAVDAEAAATTAASMHPCRLLIVIRHEIDVPRPRLDAEVLVGGRLGPGEAVVMRMFGRLALHAESVALPLLAPDAPVVTWWHGPPPERIATDPLGVLADRRITDCARLADPVAGLRQRADDFLPGDTDLGWARITLWRAALASAFDSIDDDVRSAVVYGQPTSPAALLLAGWLRSRLRIPVPVVEDGADQNISHGGEIGVGGIEIDLAHGGQVQLLHRGDAVVARTHDRPDTQVSVVDRGHGELLGEELRRLDADQPYGDALGAATGVDTRSVRPGKRTHVWVDPALGPADNGAGTG